MRVRIPPSALRLPFGGPDRARAGRHHEAGGRRDRQRGELVAARRRRRRRRDPSRRRAGDPRGVPLPRRLRDRRREDDDGRAAREARHPHRRPGLAAAASTARTSCSRLPPPFARGRGRARRRTVAFPAISTGIYGFPVERAARIAIRTTAAELERHPDIQEVRFVLFSDEHLQAVPAAPALVAQPGQSSGFRPRAQRFESSRGFPRHRGRTGEARACKARLWRFESARCL